MIEWSVGSWSSSWQWRGQRFFEQCNEIYGSIKFAELLDCLRYY